MDNKNVRFNHTLKEYNRRYRHHKNLLKLTKQEVEDFDRQFDTVGQHYVLRKNKWWFIDGIYYQVPKKLGAYWFRNLNAGVQAAICLLGAGAVATGASLPFILKLGQTVEPTITISGADFDKAESHIELHKESTIKLKQQGTKTITGIEYVKVDDNKLNEDQYSFNAETKVVTIKAEAMTSTKIEIKVTTDEPVTKATKAQFVAKANEWVKGTNGFLNSTTVYDEDKLTATIDDNPAAISEFEYSGTSETRKLVFKVGDFGDFTAASIDNSGDGLDNYIKPETVESVIYTITDEIIRYEDTNATGEGEYSVVEINKYGYVTCFAVVGNEVKITYPVSGPHEPTTVVTKQQFVDKANEWVTGQNGFCNSTLEYTSNQLTIKSSNVEKTFTDFKYNNTPGARELTVKIDGGEVYLASEEYSGTALSNDLKSETVTGVTYEIKNDEIIYKDFNADEGEYKEFHMNKYGYPTYAEDGDGSKYEYIYNGVPKEPVTPIVTKQQFVDKANEWVTGTNGFCNSKLEYAQDQVTYKANGIEQTIHHISYKDEGEDREFLIYTSESAANIAASIDYSGNELSEDLKAETIAGVTYEINDNEIIYKDSNAGYDDYKELHMNKYGYITLQLYGSDRKDEYIYNGDPKDPHVVDKATWIAKADEWVTGENGFCNSTLEYTQDQLTYKVDGVEQTINNFWYEGVGEDRCLKVVLESGVADFASSYYSGTNLDDDGMLNDEGVYEIYDNEIVYKYANETGTYNYKELHINKYGYPTYEKYGDDCLYETIWDGEPTDSITKLTLEYLPAFSQYTYKGTSIPLSLHQKLEATINYDNEHAFNTVIFQGYGLSGTVDFEVGIGEGATELIKVTSVVDTDGKELISQCSVKDKKLILAETGSSLSKKVIIKFTINKEVETTELRMYAN